MSLNSKSIKVWHRYEAKGQNGTILKLRFQDLSPHRREEAMEFNITYLLKDEAFHEATGIYKNNDAIEEYRNLLNMSSGNKHVTVCCIDDETENGGQLVGLSTAALMNNTDSMNISKKFSVKSCTKEMQSLYTMIKELENLTNVSKKFDRFYKGNGVIVHPDYRGLGIANEFFRLRRVMCDEHNVPLSAAWMTAKGSQRAAENNNWKTDVVISPEELGKRCGLTFPENTVDFKFMYITKD